MTNLDSEWTSGINAMAGRSVLADFAMVNVSQIAVPLLVLAVALQWWWRGKEKNKNRHAIIAAGLSFLLGLACNQVILLFIQRPRPYVAGITHLLIPASNDPSFPSDHATATCAIAAAFLLHGALQRGTLFVLIAVIVSFSRVFIGTHYVSDVVGGCLTGLLAALVVKAAYRPGTKADNFLVKIL
jgi:undecaprenyl-diphosphatase